MRFAFVITNLAGGGAERAVLTIAERLSRRGHQVCLVLLEEREDYSIPPDISLHVVGHLSKGTLGKRFAARRLRLLMQQLAKSAPFDLIVSALPFANEVSILANLPHLWCRVDNTLSIEIERLAATRPRKAERRSKRYCRLYRERSMIAVSQGVADDLQTSFGLDKSRIRCIYNPFDLSTIRKQAREPASMPTPRYVVHAGRFVPQKRHDVLLDAWAQIETSHHLVLLTHPDPRLDEMIGSRNLVERVIVAGFQKNPYALISGADLLILSSDHEGLPSVIIEALTLDVPVVSTDCPSGPREILGDALPECLVPVNNATALANAIRQALLTPPDISRIDLTRFDIDSIAASYEQLALNETRHG